MATASDWWNSSAGQELIKLALAQSLKPSAPTVLTDDQIGYSGNYGAANLSDWQTREDLDNVVGTISRDAKSIVDDYLRKIATAGLSRTGRKASSANSESALRLDALRELANQSASRVSKGIDYLNDLYGGREKAKTDSRKAIAAYNQALIDWQTNQSKGLTDIYKMQRSDWEADLTSAREAEKAAFERSLADRKLRLEEDNRMWEVNQQLKDKADWDRLMTKARMRDFVGDTGGWWTTADDYNLGRLRRV